MWGRPSGPRHRPELVIAHSAAVSHRLAAGPDGRSRTLLQRMAEPSQLPLPSSSGRRQPGRGPTGAILGLPAVLVTIAAVIVGTALLGAAAGFVWAAVAPRALAVVAGPDSADIVNVETNAFIAGTGWFTLLTAIGGIISGLLGYAFAVRRYRAPAMAAVLVGGLAAALTAKWIGQRSGAAAFNRALQAGPRVLLHVPLALGGLGALAFWPLAAGLVAGVIEAIILLREHQAARARVPSYGPSPFPEAKPPG